MGRFLSIGTKLALATVAVLLVVSALLYFELTGRERKSLVASKKTAASMVADLFAATLSAPLDFADNDAIDAELNNLRTNPDVSCAAVWLGDAKDPVGERGAAGCASRFSDDGSKDAGANAKVFDDRVEVYRVVVGRTGKPVGRTVLVFSLAPENAAYAESRLRILELSLLLAFGTAALLILIARQQIVTPLGRVTLAAERMGGGDLKTRVAVASKDEIGVLARAFNAMGEAIADREAKLEAVTQSLRELFDHMRQAILAFGPDAKVKGAVSRQASSIFGGELEGRDVTDLLYRDLRGQDVDAQAFEEWLPLAFNMPIEDWDEISALAPQALAFKNADKTQVPLELEFRPVARAGKIDRVMLLATDVSEKRALEATVQTQEEEHARRMEGMRRLVAGGSQVFVSFIDAAHERIERCISLLGPPTQKTLLTNDIDELFRHVHTIKGEARSFDLREVEGEAGKLEEQLDELRAKVRKEGIATTGSVHGSLHTSLERISEAIGRGREAFVAASPIGRAALDQLTVQRTDIMELLGLAGARDDAMGRIAKRLAARPFGESTASLVDRAPAWGEQEGKDVELVVEGREVGVPPKLARILGGVLTHIVRNSIAHGIESRDGREAAGKRPLAKILARAVDGPKGPVITVEDDGGGLDLARIAEKARSLGIPVDGKEGARPSTDVAELIFASGLSTAETVGVLAGRGVGLSAVRADLAGVGYVIAVETSKGAFTRFVMRPAGDERKTSRHPPT